MTFKDVLDFLISLNWQSIIAIFSVNWFFYHKLKNHQDLQDERMFYLATGRTLADAIKDDRQKDCK